MVSFTVRMRFNQEDHDKVVEILLPLTEASRREPGCVSYIPHFVEDDNATVLIYEQYKDKDALEQHRGSSHFAQYAIGGLFQLMKDRQLENLIAVA